jgi:3-hydroxyisobutyrate dehydrogenase-like beta-hydroxyacid dehydrogenase
LNKSYLHDVVVGVAGCGSMGLPMARALHEQGFITWGFDVRPVTEFGQFAKRMIEDPDEFATRCDVVISVVRDYKQTQDLLFDKQAIFHGNKAPTTCIVSSTLAPGEVAEIKSKLKPEISLIDAPMSGAPVAAEKRQLTFMLGGSKMEIQRYRTLFEAMGDTLLELGESGAGMQAKVLNNYVTSACVAAVRRVLTAAERMDVGTDKLLDVMRHSSGNTWYGENFNHISWAREGYSKENTFGILEKDMRCALSAMQSVGLGETVFDQSIVSELCAATPLIKNK